MWIFLLCVCIIFPITKTMKPYMLGQKNKFRGNRSQLRQWHCWKAVFALTLLMLGAARLSCVSLGVPPTRQYATFEGKGIWLGCVSFYVSGTLNVATFTGVFVNTCPLFLQLLISLHSKPQLLKKNELSPIHWNEFQPWEESESSMTLLSLAL